MENNVKDIPVKECLPELLTADVTHVTECPKILSSDGVTKSSPSETTIDSADDLLPQVTSDMEPDTLNDGSSNSDLIESSDPGDCHQTIMSACSSVGQHIRQNITEALNSRRLEVTSPPTNETVALLQAAVMENLGTGFVEKLSQTVVEDIQEPETSVGDKDNSEILNSKGKTDAEIIENSCSQADLEITVNQPIPSSHGPDVSNSDRIENDLIYSTENTPFSHHEGVNDNITSSLNKETMSLCDTLRKQIRQALSSSFNESESTDHQSADDKASNLEASIMKELEHFQQAITGEWSKAMTQLLPKNNSQEEIGEDNCTPSSESMDLLRSEDPLANGTDSKIDGNYDKDKPSKKMQRNADKKKGEKAIGFFTNQILKSLSGIQNNEEKLNVLCRKHAESLEKLKNTETQLKQSERQVVQLSREKEQLQADYNRNILAKSRLENLCRELQRQNKAVKEESLLRIREEEEKRKEVASKFQTTLNEISGLMQENSKKNMQLQEENAELAQKLKTLVEHYEMWEKHMEKVIQQKDLEAQLAKVKHAKTNLQLKQETENFLRDKQALLENMSELQKKCTLLATNEVQLRAELGDYSSKYEEFQTVLSKSNQVFASFKTDMDSTSKKIKKLEKETNLWKQKWEGSNKALLEMITDKQTRDKELLSARQRVLTLEKLCRALQAERKDLRSQVNKAAEEETDINQMEEVTQTC